MKAKRRLLCSFCECEHTFVRTEPNHRLHFCLTLLTVGVWGIVWGILAAKLAEKPWRCRACCGRYRPQESSSAAPKDTKASDREESELTERAVRLERAST